MHSKTLNLLNEITKELEDRFKALISLCESPIEEYFLINICLYYYRMGLMSGTFSFLSNWVDDGLGVHGKPEKCNYQEYGIDVFGYIYGVQFTSVETIKIIPQFVVDKYRLDFAVFIEKSGKHLKYCIECDGYDYHKTKEQLQKDALRARELAMEGWTTLRYTGQELNKWGYEEAFSFDILLSKNMNRE